MSMPSVWELSSIRFSLDRRADRREADSHRLIAELRYTPWVLFSWEHE